MKKIILSFAILALGAFTFNASADDNNTSNCNKARTECCGKSDCQKAGKHKGKKGDKKGGKKHGKRDANCCKSGKKQNCLFEGITLSPEQQAKIDALQQARKADRNRAPMQKGQSMDEIKKAREARDEMRAKSRKEFTEQVQQILTPEQFAIYQQNISKLKAKGESRGPRK